MSDYTPIGSFNELSWRVASVSEHIGSVEESLSTYAPKTDVNQLNTRVDNLNSSLSNYTPKTDFNTLKNKVDNLVAEGTANGWFYRKWSSGRAECWKTLSHSTALSTSWGSLYSGTATSRQDYPFTFVEKPIEMVTLQAESYQGILFPEKSLLGVNTVSQTACYNICRPSSLSTVSVFYLNFNVVGKWKE